MAVYEIPVPDIAEGRCLRVDVDGRAMLIARSASGYHACAHLCPHQAKPLDGARIRQNFLMCPHHGARFALDDGRSLSPLTPRGLSFYAVREEKGTLVIDTGTHGPGRPARLPGGAG